MIRLYNAALLSLNGDFYLYPSGRELWAQDDLILYTGPESADRPVFDREIDLHGALLLPGLKNAHTDSVRSALVTLLGHEEAHAAVGKITEEDAYTLSRFSLAQSLRRGVTAVFDASAKRDAAARAAVSLGIREVLFHSVSAADDLYNVEMELMKYNSLHPLLSCLPGIGAEEECDADLLFFMQQLVSEHELPFFSRSVKTPDAAEAFRALNDLTPTQLFAEYGLYGHGGGAFGCHALTAEDRALFSSLGLTAVACPRTSKDALSALAAEYIPIASGSGCRPLAAWQEGIFSSLGAVLNGSTRAFRPDVPLRMACLGGAHAMNLPDADCLVAGKTADLIALDREALAAGDYDRAVVLTVVGGRVVCENGAFADGTDYDFLAAEAKNAAVRLCGG